ncbi:MAG: hypothetical protein JNG86_13250 [Verrucomicrobiaceae bacterium]|nr:hypothetical protein [Verrucomicrobiaceae bacterium]
MSGRTKLHFGKNCRAERADAFLREQLTISIKPLHRVMQRIPRFFRFLGDRGEVCPERMNLAAGLLEVLPSFFRIREQPEPVCTGLAARVAALSVM